MKEPHKIMLAGDWHGNTGWARHMIEYAAQNTADAIVQLGDFGLWGMDQNSLEYPRRLQKTLAHFGIMLYWVDGNHENHDLIEELRPPGNAPWSLPDCPNIVHLPRGFRWKWWGNTWMAVGGAVSVDKNWRKEGKSWWAGEELTTADVEFCSRPGDVDIIVSHDCPTGVDIPGIGANGKVTDGSSDWPQDALDKSVAHRLLLRKIVDAVRPSKLFHGHYHRLYLGKLREMEVWGLAEDGSRVSDNIMFLNKPESVDG